MRLCSGQPSAEFALFTRLRTARGTTNRERFLLCDSHPYTMHGNLPTRWSIMTIAVCQLRRIISVRRVEGQRLRLRRQCSDDGRISPLNLFSGAPCSINWLRTEINPPSRYWRTLEHHQTPKALGSHRFLALHISLTPRNLQCPSLLTSPTLKSQWMILLTSLTKAYSRGAKRESCSCRVRR